MDLSIIIVSFNTKKPLLSCLRSIAQNTVGISYEIIVIDNASTDGSQELPQNFQFLLRPRAQDRGAISNFQLIKNKTNLGFAMANNQGIKKAGGRYILLLNSDTELKENSLAKMVHWMDKHPKAGIATCKLLNTDGTIQGTGGHFPDLLRIVLWATFLDDFPFIANLFGSYHPHTPKFGSSFYNIEHPQDWVTGAFFLFRRELIKKAGYLDGGFFMYVEEVDYCFRAKKLKWEVWYVPRTEVIHLGGASGGLSGVVSGEGLVRAGSVTGEFRGLKRFYRKHYPIWQYPLLGVLLKLAAFLRIFVFGILGRQKQAWRIYGKAFAIG